MSGYVELHARSAFSFLRGASQPEHLAEEAARLGLPAMAVCDRDGVYGAPRFFQAARQQGLRSFVGAEVTLADGSALPLLAMNRTGYQNLCRLITEAKLVERTTPPAALAGGPPVSRGELMRSPLEGRAPTQGLDRKRPCFATWAEVERFSEGLIALTGDEEGPILRAWAQQGPKAAGAALWRLAGIFGHDRLFVEMQCHLARGDERRLRFLADLADAHALPLLATGGVTHATRMEREVADVFTCLRHHTTLDAAGRLLAPNGERHLRSARCMQIRFRDFPEAVSNSLRVAERLEFTLRDLGYRFPDFPVEPGETQESGLRARVFAGARERYGEIMPPVRAQLEKELALIEKLGFCGYFLVVWDICRWCREHGILVQGRGSAANSIVCYVLQITAVDPIKYHLFFERFLSEGRVGPDGHPSWPDIDLDLPSGDLRESAIQELYQRYAPRGAAMTANVITYRGRSAAREVGKVLGLGDDILDRFASLYAGGDFPHTLKLEEQLKMSGLAENHPRLPALARLYRRVYGLPRHLGQHSGGMVICAGQLDGVVPLEPASMDDRVVVQWDKDDCEDLGIVKVDLLGLGMVAVLQDCFAMCRERGEAVAMHTIPADDAKTYAMMQVADTIGVFQIESRAQMSTLRKFKPACFYDVAMEVAIVRPGPIVARVAHPLLKRRAGLEPIVCLDPSVHEIMRPVLERTYGVILFQEQMLQVAVILAGFTPTEAEELRRAMGFTRGTERLARIMDKLCTSMRARGHHDRVIEMVQDSAYSFALYGFPEAHSVSFALIAYASTWLKAHRPAEFVASLLNNQPMGFYSPATLVQDARRHGVVFRPVCVAHSAARCRVEPDGAVRIGLNYVKGVREAAITDMLAARAERPFASVEDWLARTAFTATERRALASVGALNVFATHRRAALWQVEAAWETEETLFKGRGLHMGDPSPAPGLRERRSEEKEPEQEDLRQPLAPMTLTERYQADFAGVTLTTGIHPMALVRDRLPEAWRATDLPLARNGDRVTVAGSVICRQRPGTAKGFLFVSLEDETGVANVVVTPQLFESHRLVITQSHALAITGRLQNQDGVIHVKAERFAPLTPAELPASASHDFR